MSRWIITTSVLITLIKCCHGAQALRNFWFSPYGLPEYGRRIPHEGTNLGTMTMVQCSRKCADSDFCQAYQFEKTGDRAGICYTFTSLTYNTLMIPAPGHKYFEKRSCYNVYHMSAGIMYQDIMRLILFTGDKTIIFDVIVDGSRVLFKGKMSHYHNTFFPGVVGSVDGVFQGPSGLTFVVEGNTVKCFQARDADYIYFEECGPSEAAMLAILDPYFASESYLDGIVALDDTGNDVHIFKNNTVYHLQWSNADTKYNVIDDFAIDDTGSQNIWVNAPVNVTAMTRLHEPNTILLVEDYKLVLYDIQHKQPKGILFMCDYSS